MASSALTLLRGLPELGSAGLSPRVSVLDCRDCASASGLVRWNRLAELASEPNPFFESWYLLPSLEALDGGSATQLLVVEQDGAWIGLLPLARSPRYYGRPIPHLASWVHANCFLGAPLVARGCEVAFWTALLDWADKAAGKALFLHMTQMPLDGPLHRALDEVLARQHRRGAVVQAEERAVLQSDLTPEAYLEASLTGKKRKELRRQAARLAEEGALTFERRDEAEGVDHWAQQFLKLEVAGWKGRSGSALACSDGTAQLFGQALRAAAGAGRLERLSLSLDGRPIAMLANFLTPPGSFSYKTAFDEDYSRFSPGVLLQRENLVLLEREGIDWCDSCAAADHPMIDHIWRERRRVGRLSIAIGGKLRRMAFSALLSLELGRRPSGVKR